MEGMIVFDFHPMAFLDPSGGLCLILKINGCFRNREPYIIA